MSKNNELKNQVYLYSLETLDFYTDEEKENSNLYFKALRIKNRIKEKRKINTEYINYYEEIISAECESEDELNLEICKSLYKKDDLYQFQIMILNAYISKYDEKLNELLDSHEGHRTLRSDSLKSNKMISIFESPLTRILELKNKKQTDDLFVIRVYHYKVLNSILEHGFEHNGEMYEYFTSSAGQIRTKKIVCIKSSTYSKYKNTINCGLDVKDINAKGGVNSNKYQAYLALINSASNKWKRFNIDNIIVVDDFSTIINAKVDNIDRNTFNVVRENVDIELEHMDGCGIMLPTVGKNSFMFRMPWMKGLLTSFDFVKFINENKDKGATSKIKDIYGKEWDIIEDKISIILTASQFKMWKYYDSWQEYKDNFNTFKCEASKLNIEDIGADANLNYQMLQTLTTITDDELKLLAQNTVDDIQKLGSDRTVMLRILGATRENKNKNYFQKALQHYPEMLSDIHSREVIKDKKRSLVNDARAGKLRINGKYTYIIPDLYAFCEWLFLNEEKPKGLLGDGQVYCSIFEEGKVDILRSPHLYREHAIRNNVMSKQLSEWFISKGVYISSHDMISRILQCDFDGDKALVVQDDVLIEVAEREMEDIVPLYYEMKKAEAKEVNAETLYTALTSAYKANIGIISNDITKIWNSEKPNIEAVKWLAMYNNFVIDYAKTLYLPNFPEYIEQEIKSFTKSKLPFFFQYAKDKEEGKVEKINNSTVNRLYGIIPNKPIQFKRVAGHFDYRNLMNTKYPSQSKSVIDKYNELNRSKHTWLDKNTSSTEFQFNEFMRMELSKLHKSEKYIADVLVEYLYSSGNKDKSGLWDVFGDILCDNVIANLGNTISCEVCKIRTEKINETSIYCEACAKEKSRISKLQWWHRNN